MTEHVAKNTGRREWNCLPCGKKLSGPSIAFQDYIKAPYKVSHPIGHICPSCQFISCDKCGRETGFRSWASLYKKPCSRCKTRLDNPILILSGRLFGCFVPDRALTRYEQLTVGITTGGAFRGIFRNAYVSLDDGELIIKAQTDVVAGSNPVTLATIAINDIAQIRATPIPVDRQIRAVLGRSVVVGGGFAFAIIIASFVGMSKSGGQGNLGVAFMVAVLAGLAVGFFFSFLPGYFKVKKDLLEVQFACKDGRVFPIALIPVQMDFAKPILETHGLHLAESNKDTTS